MFVVCERVKRERERGIVRACVLAYACKLACVRACVCDTGGPLRMIVCADTHHTEEATLAARRVSQCLASLGSGISRHLLADLFFKNFFLRFVFRFV